MLFTLAAVVFFAAIITFFSQEFIRMFKKIMDIKGAKLVLPLLAASWLMLSYDYWALWVVYYFREVLNWLVRMLTYIIPFGQVSSYIACIIVLTILPLAPVFGFDLLIYRKKNFKPYPHTYLVSSCIWLVCALALIVL
ncbi:hypothetical protein [Legionella fallonii]|uniref:Uncharacterized protein n=1 Tax=Legionella fallonii LLAP-10 TaxID=1212491 RepID=A0A098G6I7_9GAMM|nr:hypothetical protein [Legionella fallonii]CEG57579.1 conserved membrane protein of unknown function [Legionella fallonii LLAP-10]